MANFYKAHDEMNAVSLADAITHGGEIQGKAIITMTDLKTGKRERMESKNLVTDAVYRLFSKNWMMNAELSQLVPMEKLFGGILCFQNTMPNATVDTVYCPNELQNPMIACAGDQAHITRNPYRGNPVPQGTSISHNTMTRTWEWQALQGNGDINCLALTSAVGGNMGLKPFDVSNCPINTIANNNSDSYMFPDENQGSTSTNVWNATAITRRPVCVDDSNPRYVYCASVFADEDSPFSYNLIFMKCERPALTASFASSVTNYKVVSSCLSPVICLYDDEDPLKMYITTADDNYLYALYMSNYVDEHNVWTPSHMLGYKIAKNAISEGNVETFSYDLRWNLVPFFEEYLGISNLEVRVRIKMGERANAAPWQMINPVPCENGKIVVTVECYEIVDVSTVLRWEGDVWMPIDHNPLGSDLEIIEGTVNNLDTYDFKRSYQINRGNTNYWSPNCVKLGEKLYFLTGDDSGYLFNGDRWYRTAPPARPNGLYTSTITEDPDGVINTIPSAFPALMFSAYSRRGLMKTRSGYCYSNLYLATVNNLQTTLEKRDNKSMNIQYELTIL